MQSMAFKMLPLGGTGKAAEEGCVQDAATPGAKGK